MCTDPHSFAKQISQKYLEKNLGDLSLFPASAELEQETVSMLGSLLSNSKAFGSIVSGGTEHSTVLGTRSVASVVAVWALLKHLGRAGYTAIVEHCFWLTWKLAEAIQ